MYAQVVIQGMLQIVIKMNVVNVLEMVFLTVMVIVMN